MERELDMGAFIAASNAAEETDVGGIIDTVAPYLTITFKRGIDGKVIAACKELSGVMSQGNTMQEAFENLCEVYILTKEARNDLGLPVPWWKDTNECGVDDHDDTTRP